MQESCLKSKPISIASIMRNSPDVVGARETTSLRVCYFFFTSLILENRYGPGVSSRA